MSATNPHPDFSLGQKVRVDREIEGVVTAICWRTEFSEIEVCWWNSGDHKSAWFSPWRLTDGHNK